MDNHSTDSVAGQKKEAPGRLIELLMGPELWLSAAAQVSGMLGLGSGIYTKLSQDFLQESLCLEG